jgi:hypothetical protein
MPTIFAGEPLRSDISVTEVDASGTCTHSWEFSTGDAYLEIETGNTSMFAINNAGISPNKSRRFLVTKPTYHFGIRRLLSPYSEEDMRALISDVAYNGWRWIHR